MRLLDWRGGDDATPGGFRSSTDEASAEAPPLDVDGASTVRPFEFSRSAKKQIAQKFRAGRLTAVSGSGRLSLIVRDSDRYQFIVRNSDRYQSATSRANRLTTADSPITAGRPPASTCPPGPARPKPPAWSPPPKWNCNEPQAANVFVEPSPKPPTCCRSDVRWLPPAAIGPRLLIACRLPRPCHSPLMTSCD